MVGAGDSVKLSGGGGILSPEPSRSAVLFTRALASQGWKVDL